VKGVKPQIGRIFQRLKERETAKVSVLVARLGDAILTLWDSKKMSNKKHPIQLTCQYCGKKFDVWNYQKDTAKYCSMKCFGLMIRKEKIVKTCKYCYKEFSVVPSYGANKYCCHECSAMDMMAARIERVCEQCKKKFSVTPYFKDRKYCCQGCFGLAHSGENSPSWKGGKSFEPYTVNWTKTLRRSIRERDKYICQLCHKEQGDRALAVHHIDYDKANNDPNNLISLCESCHGKTNEQRDMWTRYFWKHL